MIPIVRLNAVWNACISFGCILAPNWTTVRHRKPELVSTFPKVVKGQGPG